MIVEGGFVPPLARGSRSVCHNKKDNLLKLIWIIHCWAVVVIGG